MGSGCGWSCLILWVSQCNNWKVGMFNFLQSVESLWWVFIFFRLVMMKVFWLLVSWQFNNKKVGVFILGYLLLCLCFLFIG